jgi:hypothetical protein
VAQTQGLRALIQRHYDKVIALAGLLALLLSILVLFMAGQRSRDDAAAFEGQLTAIRPAHPTAAPLAIGSYSNALSQLARPFRIAVIDESAPGFFVPEKRVWCAACRRPIPFAATNCPYANCGVAQPREPTERAGYDGDGGGIPSEAEKNLGLNMDDPKDDTADSDSDGFSNLDEFRAETDLRDPKSHPNIGSLLRVVDITSTELPLKFMAASKLPNGKVRCQINMAGDSYFVVESERIGKTDFTMARYVETTERKLDKIMNRERDFVIQKVILQRGQREIVLPLNEGTTDKDYSIKLLLPLDGTTYTASLDSKFTLRNETYRVISVDPRAYTVVIRNDTDGRELTVPRLP